MLKDSTTAIGKKRNSERSHEYCQLDNFLSTFLPLPTKVCLSLGRALLTVGASRMFLLAIWPSQTLPKSSLLQWHSNNFSSREASLSGAIRNFERVRVLQSFCGIACAQVSSPMPLPSTYNLDTLYVTMWLWNIYLMEKPSVPGVTQTRCLSICNHGTAATTAVTALLGKMLASSRRLDSVLDTSRLKHTIILANPRLLMVRI